MPLGTLYAIASRRLNHRRQTATGSESRRKSSPLINFKTVIPSELTIGSGNASNLPFASIYHPFNVWCAMIIASRSRGVYVSVANFQLKYLSNSREISAAVRFSAAGNEERSGKKQKSSSANENEKVLRNYSRKFFPRSFSPSESKYHNYILLMLSQYFSTWILRFFPPLAVTVFFTARLRNTRRLKLSNNLRKRNFNYCDKMMMLI